MQKEIIINKTFNIFVIAVKSIDILISSSPEHDTVRSEFYRSVSCSRYLNLQDDIAFVLDPIYVWNQPMKWSTNIYLCQMS